MSSGENPSTAATNMFPPPSDLNPKPYFCYQCNRTISLLLPPDADISCPHCHGGFLEEVDLPSLPSPPPFLPLPLPFLSSSPSPDFAPLVDPIDLSSFFPRPHNPNTGPTNNTNNNVFDPFQFLHNYLVSMRQGGANIQFVIENNNNNPNNNGNNPAGGGFVPVGGAGSNLGDYFFGPGLEQLIQHLAENDPNRYGTPPASKSAVEALPSVQVDKEVLNSDIDSAQCAVCMDEFELGAEGKQLPCKHVFHKGCIVPWLELHNSCPVCRFELPTDDPDYEQRRARGEVATDGSGGNAEGSSDANRAAERRFRISLPWPFRASQGEGSDGGGGSSRTYGSYEDLD